LTVNGKPFSSYSSEDARQIREQSGGKIDYCIQIMSHQKFLESKEEERGINNENFENKTMDYINNDLIQDYINNDLMQSLESFVQK